ncbi:hypothetical protein LWI29_007170 [Acer saccharum]|uniref:Uncharacterized protein n=1 Tax=Acer saccharum TaxID=4024 RepID=A0AA39VBV6_ACESA|nr:hypothetical protein LWI29_007170 [Acer saccharum]
MEEGAPQIQYEQQAHGPNPQEQQAFEQEGSVHGDEQLGLTMSEYTLPFVGNVLTTIILNDVARQYELKNMHIGLLPSFSGRHTEDCLQFMKQYGATLETFSVMAHQDNSFKAFKNTLHTLEQRMTAYMQFNDQRANSHGVSLKKMETQLAQLLDAVVKQNKGKSPSTDEHINVLEVVEEEVEKVVRPKIIPNQVRVLDHSTKVDVDNVVKGTKNEERENGEISPLN